MSFTKTTARALAASIAFVVAGGTVAGAAVFHLPMLGFGRAPSAATAAVPVTTPTTARKVQPRVIVRTRYVDDIVHRPAPRTTLDAAVSGPPAAPSRAATAAPPQNVAPPTAAPATVAPPPQTDERATEHRSEHERTGASAAGEEGDD